MALKMQVTISVQEIMKCVPNFEYESSISLLRMQFRWHIFFDSWRIFFCPFSSVPYAGSHIPTSKDSIYHPFGQMYCKYSFIAPSSQAVLSSMLDEFLWPFVEPNQKHRYWGPCTFCAPIRASARPCLCVLLILMFDYGRENIC